MLSNELLRFIRQSIGSVWALAVREWSVKALTHELRSSVGTVSEVLVRLGDARIVEENDGLYRYHPAGAEIEAVIGALALDYAEFPIAVTQAIFAAPNDKIRLSPTRFGSSGLELGASAPVGGVFFVFRHQSDGDAAVAAQLPQEPGAAAAVERARVCRPRRQQPFSVC